MIELIIFIVITAIVVVPILAPAIVGLLSSGTTANQGQANWLATQCLESLLGQRLLTSYNTLSCPSTPNNAFCNSVTGFTITPSVVCTTLGTDNHFKTVTVVVSGPGGASAALKALIADY